MRIFKHTHANRQGAMRNPCESRLRDFSTSVAPAAVYKITFLSENHKVEEWKYKIKYTAPFISTLTQA